MATVTSTSLRKPRYEGLRVTREEYLDLDDDGFKYDVQDGVMTMAPSPNFEHNEIAVDFLYNLRRHLKTAPLGHLVAETDVLLPDGGDPLRPDISFILNQNMHIVKTHIHGSPDLIGEILSDATRDRDLGEKAERYLKSGVREYWIVDPRNKSFELWRNAGTQWEKITGDAITSRLIPGFELKKSDLFG